MKHRSGSPSGPRHARGSKGGELTVDLGLLRRHQADERRLRAIEDDETTELPAVSDDGEPGRSRLRRALVGAGRGLVALASTAVLVASGVSWASLTNLQRNLNTTDVLADLPSPEATTAAAADGATDILLVGSDSRTDANGNPLPLDVLRLLRTEESSGLNTDTIILVRVPNDGGRAVAVSVPRDTYVDIPGFREDKINSAYGVTKRIAHEQLEDGGVTDPATLERESNQAGRRVLVQVVQELMGVEVDHYAEINLYGFYLLTEAIGGIEVCLKRATKDPGSGADFQAGRQLVAGGDALAFVRQRGNLPRGDLDRIVRQQVFMAAVANRVLSTGTLTNPGKLRGLTDAAQKAVVLDSGWDVLAFARQMQGIAAGNVEFVTIPVVSIDARNERGQSIVAVDQEAVRAFVAGLLTGQPPPPTSSEPEPSSPPPVSRRAVLVEAANGTRHPGLATRVLDALADAGYRVGEPGNAPPRKRTEIRVGPGARPVAEQIVATLGGGLPIVSDPSLAPARALILLGSDYEGPGAESLAGPRLFDLDGAAARQAPTDPNPITANGIPCVN